MIKVSLPPGVVYDMLSILEVKGGKSYKKSVMDSIFLLESEIEAQIGAEFHADILKSEEYLELLRFNTELFNLIDYLKSPAREPGRCHDTEVDDLNHSRWIAKNKLQDKFFPDCAEKEVKLGYTNT